MLVFLSFLNISSLAFILPSASKIQFLPKSVDDYVLETPLLPFMAPFLSSASPSARP